MPYLPFMDMGDLPAWGALIVSVAAAGASFRALRHAKDSVTQSKRSADAADASVALTRRSSEAAERSARVAEETLADQRREAAERRAAEEEANRPRADLRVRHLAKSKWVLVNQGSGSADNIICMDGDPYIARNWPNGASIPAGGAHEFVMVGAAGKPIPSVLRLKWDGQDEPVSLVVPR
ncbi:hypothetical protein [Streptomyces sp. V1I6]|uniref:hypothetical protein n=1 Tax=Streptomyces sp. V1I6 TaxID=3042273 RepID=UPI00277F0D77|nr:hypothetical protein [Streptomyces sp. V1I6]MDQ0848050.1 pyruvate/2-oxoglutarate dehydrogenase complex dihydrolipoamide acyltransferase (E2) component [Streptomyces sp. V1I6]